METKNQQQQLSHPSNELEVIDGKVPFISNFQVPFNKDVGKEYWYIHNNKPKCGILSKMRIDILHVVKPFDDKEYARLYFAYKMDNGDTPRSLFNSKEEMINILFKQNE